MLNKFFIIFMISTSIAFANSREEAKFYLEKISGLSSTLARMDKASGLFLGLPYGKGGPLGEGANGRYDQDPLYRFDIFDCTTYVETIVSLALSTNVEQFELQMDRIRYEDGEVEYLKRNHFPSLQWIPHNVKNGLLKEVNDVVVPRKQQRTAEAVINLPGWLRKISIDQIVVPEASVEEKEILLAELSSLAPSYSPVVARLQYIPIPTLVKRPRLINRIPDGSIVNIVRPNWDITDLMGSHMNVSHQGLLFRKGRTLYMRHASTTGLVVEVPFLDYIKQFVGHATIKGVHLMQVQ